MLVASYFGVAYIDAICSIDTLSSLSQNTIFFSQEFLGICKCLEKCQTESWISLCMCCKHIPTYLCMFIFVYVCGPYAVYIWIWITIHIYLSIDRSEYAYTYINTCVYKIFCIYCIYVYI